MEAFRTPGRAKRTYRELKLLRDIRHGNVSDPRSGVDEVWMKCGKRPSLTDTRQIISLLDSFISPLNDVYVGISSLLLPSGALLSNALVTGIL